MRASIPAPVRCTSRRAAVALAAVLLPGAAAGLAGVPPFEWFAGGNVMPEYKSHLTVRPEAGIGGGYAGAEGERSMKAADYLTTAVVVRYGLWSGLEAYAAVPVYWGSSPQKYVDRLTNPPREHTGTVSGIDIGDVGVAARWRMLESDDERMSTVVVAGIVMPMGSNVWQDYPKASFVRTAPDKPELLAVGDGAWKILVGLQERFSTDAFRIEALGGYLLKFPLRATVAELSSLHEITVRQPSPVVARIAPEYMFTDGWWLTGRIDGFWSGGGSVKGGGILARDPGSAERILDSYVNQIESSGGVWAGAGLRWEYSEEIEIGIDFAAPVAVQRSYRYWRAGAVVAYAFDR